MTVPESLLARRLWAAIWRIHSQKAWTSGLRLAVEVAIRQQTATDLAVVPEDGSQRSFPQIRARSPSGSGGHAHALQGRSNEHAAQAALAARITAGNRPKSYRTARSALPAVGRYLTPSCRESGKNGFEWRESQPTPWGHASRVREPEAGEGLRPFDPQVGPRHRPLGARTRPGKTSRPRV